MLSENTTYKHDSYRKVHSDFFYYTWVILPRNRFSMYTLYLCNQSHTLNSWRYSYTPRNVYIESSCISEANVLDTREHIQLIHILLCISSLGIRISCVFRLRKKQYNVVIFLSWIYNVLSSCRNTHIFSVNTLKQ